MFHLQSKVFPSQKPRVQTRAEASDDRIGDRTNVGTTAPIHVPSQARPAIVSSASEPRSTKARLPLSGPGPQGLSGPQRVPMSVKPTRPGLSYMPLQDQKIDAILYILCFDTKSEGLAQERFSKYKWASILRIPDELQHSGRSLFEDALFTDLLEPRRAEWIQKDFVGTLSYKATQKINVTKIDRLLGLGTLGTVNAHEVDAIFFLCLGCNVMGNTNWHPAFGDIWTSVVKKECHLTCEAQAVANYFMVRPIQMMAYLSMFNRTFWPALSAHPRVNQDAKYRGTAPKDKLIKMTGHPQQTHHCFVAERFFRPQFTDRQFKCVCL